MSIFDSAIFDSAIFDGEEIADTPPVVVQPPIGRPIDPPWHVLTPGRGAWASNGRAGGIWSRRTTADDNWVIEPPADTLWS